MYNLVANQVYLFFLKRGTIVEDEKEVFIFGFERIIAMTVSFALLMFTGILLSTFLEALIFFFVFLLTRKYAGGFHASTYVKCNTLYLITFLLCLFTYRYRVLDNNFILVFFALFSLITVVLFAPIENPVSPILNGDASKYYRYAVGIEILILGAAALLRLFEFDVYILVLSVLFSAAIYMHIEMIKRKEWRINETIYFKKNC